MEILVLRKQGKSLRGIASEVGCAVNTVRQHLASEGAPKYQREVKRITKLAKHESYLRARQESAKPLWIPATVLFREIVARGYDGGESQLRAFMRSLKPVVKVDPLVRFETDLGEQMQVDWVEFRKGKTPLYAFCATLGYSRASYVEFVSNMKVETLIECHQHAFMAFGGVPQRILYDNMKTVVLERDTYGDGQHKFHAGFLDYAKHCGFVIKLCRPYRAKTKGKVERFNGYLRRSFYVPLTSRLAQDGVLLDIVTANIEVTHWLAEVANERIHGGTLAKPNTRLKEEQCCLQALPPVWRGDTAAARPQSPPAISVTNLPSTQPVPDSSVRLETVANHLAQAIPAQHPLAIYEELLHNLTQGVAP